MSRAARRAVGRSRVCWRSSLAIALTMTLAAAAAVANAGELDVVAPQVPVARGDVFLVTVRQLPAGADAEGLWGDERLEFVAVGATEALALVGVDLEAKPGKCALVVQVRAPGSAPASWERPIEVVAKDFGVQHLTLPKHMVTLNKATLARVRREAVRMSALWPKRTREAYWRGEFVPPVPGQLATPFGIARILNGEPRSAHSGVDLRAALGEEVRATNRGRVALVGSFFFNGLSVVLDHGVGLYSMYFHLSKVNVALGDMVEKGGAIGLAGSTGRSTGPHLHWAVRLAGARVDPFALIRATSLALAPETDRKGGTP
jgi:murein DD-endopeptidase MepM/ murein hydrolase activator NlpD